MSSVLQAFPVAVHKLAEVRSCIIKFCGIQLKEGRKIALVTSGGTTVPLEKNTVRFIDNFSSGTRGSASAEYFLEHGYSVVFLNRQGSIQPFDRHFHQLHSSLLDKLALVDGQEGQELVVDVKQFPNAVNVFKKYRDVTADQRLLKVPFSTISEYCQYLWLVCEVLGSQFGKKALLYLAAAVSDFYIPEEKMAEHKISMDTGMLTLELHCVPKMLRELRIELLHDAYFVTFKLETNPDVLISKSQKALAKYGHQLVIGNLLNERKSKVILITPDSEPDVIVISESEMAEGRFEIEEKIVTKLVKMHNDYIADGGSES